MASLGLTVLINKNNFFLPCDDLRKARAHGTGFREKQRGWKLKVVIIQICRQFAKINGALEKLLEIIRVMGKLHLSLSSLHLCLWSG